MFLVEGEGEGDEPAKCRSVPDRMEQGQTVDAAYAPITLMSSQGPSSCTTPSLNSAVPSDVQPKDASSTTPGADSDYSLPLAESSTLLEIIPAHKGIDVEEELAFYQAFPDYASTVS